MGSLWIQTYRLNPSKPSSQESRGFNHGSVKDQEEREKNREAKPYRYEDTADYAFDQFLRYVEGEPSDFD